MKLQPLSLFFIFAILRGTEGRSAALRDTFSDTWAATDALGRDVLVASQAPLPRTGKTVAMFYYLWHGQHGVALFDIAKILASDNPEWGPPGTFHYWSEPLYGYYRSDDEWVICKNAQMLSDAGVDVIFFDVTNGFTYREVYKTLCRVYSGLREKGRRTPQVAFLAHADSGRVVQELYDDFYAPGLYTDLWFRWQGKPLVLAESRALSPDMKAFFTVRDSWAWDPGEGKWPWLEATPQKGGFKGGVLEQMPASTAEHPISNKGKSFHGGAEPPISPPGSMGEHTGEGLYFAEQLERAIQADPRLLFITQWNEWMAQRFLAQREASFLGRTLQPGEMYFVDVYSPEFNRDIEPMKGGYGDNYYYQLVSAVRRFKGVRRVDPPSIPVTIKTWQDWEAVRPEYRDDWGDTVHRDAEGMGGLHYVNRTGRNDIVIAKAARDDKAFFFYVETAEPLTPQDNSHWMNLFLRLDSCDAPSWTGFHYLVRPEDDTTNAPFALFKYGGDGSWNKRTRVRSAMDGRCFTIRILFSDLMPGIVGIRTPLSFKWADNMQNLQPEDWILNGDAAPNGRFRYRYEPRW